MVLVAVVVVAIISTSVVDTIALAFLSQKDVGATVLQGTVSEFG